MLSKITILCIPLLLGPCLAVEPHLQERQLSTPPVTTPTPTPTSITATISSTTCVVAPTVTMSYFNWFNSSHNVDCANWNFPSDSEVCWITNTTTGVSSLCETEDPCICTGYCEVGLPSVAYQPYGWGPPDTLAINFDGTLGEPPACVAENPTSAGRVWELGAGTFDCGFGPNVSKLVIVPLSFRSSINSTTQRRNSLEKALWRPLYCMVARSEAASMSRSFCITRSFTNFLQPLAVGFYGDSNADSGNNGSVYYNDVRDGACAFDNYPQYTATFPLSCTRDDQNNATCVTSLPVILTFAGWYT